VIRRVETDADLDRWVAIKNAVVPNEPTTPAQVRASAGPERLLVLVDDVACGIADRSGFGGKAFIGVRVLEHHRRRGIGTMLYLELARYARTLGLDGVNAFVYANEPHSIAFAERFGLREVDYQLEQVRTIGDEPAPPANGVVVEPVAGRRDELLPLVWERVAVQAFEDLPLPGEVTYDRDQWLREEATRPEGSFVALEDGELVGYAGLMEHADGPAKAEHGLTAVRRDRRGHGIGRALKQAQLHWAARAGVHELVTWTQKGNERMQALNRSLGYVDHSKVLTYQGPLP
jgi:GNAT superfamily N-acetyltransferase